MKKKMTGGGYNSPKLDVVNVQRKDVITTSGGPIDNWIGDRKEWLDWDLSISVNKEQ